MNSNREKQITSTTVQILRHRSRQKEVKVIRKVSPGEMIEQSPGDHLPCIV